MRTVKHTDVLIVGAGPSGLMMAAQLLRHGVQPMIIDTKPGPDREPKGGLLHARSLEVFRQLELSDRLLAQGRPCYAVQLHGRHRLLGTFDFTRIAATRTAFPFIQRIGQDDIEKLLLDRLTERACPVEWETRLESLNQDDNGAIATIVHNGKRQDCRCAWVIGADGQDSTVRRLLNIPFEGETHRRNLFVADVEIKHADSRNIRLFLLGTGPVAIVPLGADDRYRIMGPLPAALQPIEDRTLRYVDIKQEVDSALGFDLSVERCLRIDRFGYRKQTAEQLGRQRCFLIGDAAHGLSPTIGRAMNEGLLDAANLAWKLAGVVGGRLAPNVLHTYQQERMPVLRMGEGIFGVSEKLQLLPEWLRNVLLARKVIRIGDNVVRLQRTFDRLAGLDAGYRRSPLAVHHASGRRVQAGDRLPYLPVFDEKARIQTDLHRWCEKPGFVLLLLGTISHHHLHVIGQWMRQKYPRTMHLYYLPYSISNEQVFEAFEIKPNATKIVLIRPDMHIGYINDMLNVSLIDTYMEEILGWKFFGPLPEKH